MYNCDRMSEDIFKNPEFISNFISLAGFVFGLGSTTVIDILGFLGRNSGYWTRATISGHKVTKPLIWFGIFLITIGTGLDIATFGFDFFCAVKIIIITALIVNGSFLTFFVSPFLLKKEAQGKEEQLLPDNLKFKITLSFLLSISLWWSLFLITVYNLTQR